MRAVEAQTYVVVHLLKLDDLWVREMASGDGLASLVRTSEMKFDPKYAMIRVFIWPVRYQIRGIHKVHIKLFAEAG